MATKSPKSAAMLQSEQDMKIHGRPAGWMDERGWLLSDATRLKYSQHYDEIQKGYDTAVFTAAQLKAEPHPANLVLPVPVAKGEAASNDRKMLQWMLEQLGDMSTFCGRCGFQETTEDWDITAALIKYVQTGELPKEET